MDFGKNTRRNMVAVTAFLATSLAASLVNADACDYRPSKWLNGWGASGGVVGGTVAAAGTGGKIAGYYTLVHATTHATMLGSTAAGGSAAGTAGILAGTGTGAGAVASVILAPVTIIAASVVAVGTGAFEGVCYFQDERITDFDDVVKRLKLLQESNPDDVKMFFSSAGNEYATILLTTAQGQVSYYIEDLYIVNGELKHRDWAFNTTIGKLAFIAQPSEAEGQN